MLVQSLLFVVLVAHQCFGKAVDDAVTHHSVRPRSQAPNFKAKAVINDNFINVELKDYKSKQWVILLFYPYDYTFVCPTEIISFSEAHDQFAKINTSILAISTDSHHTHLAWTRMSREDGGVGQLKIPLVADTSKKISKDYGVLVDDEEDEIFGGMLSKTSIAFIHINMR
jgi:alkyl hydroperoxide reductase subunit AhpC